MTNDGVWIVGAGGLARGAADLLQRAGQPVAGLVTIDLSGHEWFDGPVVLESAFRQRTTQTTAVIAIGDTGRRLGAAVSLQAAMPQLRFATLIDPEAVVARSAEIGEGTILMARATVAPQARVGRHVVIYTGAIIEHDSIVDDFASLAPGAVLGGGVKVGEASFIGLGAMVSHGVSIGCDTIVGMASGVTRDLPANVVAVGTPAHVIRARSRGETFL